MDVSRLVRLAATAALLALAVTVVALFVAGVHSNSRISRLHDHGVAVTVTVSGCLGLLGGSGSNLAGYSCTGTFTLSGHSYRRSIPGDTLYARGTKLAAVTVPGDPSLLLTRAELASEHPSSGVFILPGALSLLLLILVAAALRRRQHLRGSPHGHPGVAA